MKKLLRFTLIICLFLTIFACGQEPATVKVGDPAPDFSLVDLRGKTWVLSELKGQVVFINFWATWCPPCIAEMPSIQNLYTDYKDKVEFLLVTNDPYSEINEFLSKNNYDFKILRPVTFNTSVFDVSTIPRTFLIDKTGRIIIDETGAANWNSDKVRLVIDNLLKE